MLDNLRTKLFFGDGKNSQEEPSEFLIMILEHDDNLSQRFTIKTINMVVCMTCTNESSTEANPQVLLYINQTSQAKGSISTFDVQTRINSLTEVEILEQSEFWYCECCKKKNPTQKSLSITSSPLILALHCTAYSLDKKGKNFKSKNRLQPPFELLFGPSKMKYVLRSILQHQGTGSDKGHYVATTYRPENKWAPPNNGWVKINDDKIEQFTKTDSFFEDVHLLFYEQVDESSLNLSASSSEGCGRLTNLPSLHFSPFIASFVSSSFYFGCCFAGAHPPGKLLLLLLLPLCLLRN